MSHPIRVSILAMLEQRTASPNQLSRWLGVTLGMTAYHVGRLRDLGLIELAHETRVRGAVEHHYKAKPRPTMTREAWSRASPTAKQALVSARLKTVESHTNASAAAGGFSRLDAVIECKTARVDVVGWAALIAEAARFLERVEIIEAEAAERMEDAGDEGAVDAGVVVLGFESVSLGDLIPSSQ